MNVSLAEGTPTWRGGERLSLAVDGAALPLASVTVVAPAGTATGTSGRGDGTLPVFQGLLTTFLPPVDPSTTSLIVRVTGADGVSAQATLPVYGQIWGSYTFSLRSYLPSTWDTGARRMADVPPGGETSPSSFASLTASLADGLNEMGGTPLTRLSSDAAVGDTVFHVEHAASLPTTGAAQVDGVPYAYATAAVGPANPNLGGISVLRGTAVVPGAQAFHASGAQVALVGAPTSDLVLTKNATFLDTAEGAFLTALGRNLGVAHSPAVASDDQYRALVKAVAYGPKSSMYGLQLALNALLGAGNYTLREDPVGAPCRVFIGLGYTALTQPGSLGRTYMAAETTVAPDASGVLTLDAPVFGVGAVYGLDGDGAPVRSRDLNLLEGTASTSVDTATITVAGTTVPAPLITPSNAPSPLDVGAKIDLQGGAQPGRYVVAEVRGAAYAVHQGLHPNTTVGSVSGGSQRLTIDVPDGAYPETYGPLVYPRDIGRTVAAAGQTGTIAAILDPLTGANLASMSTPLVQRSNVALVAGLNLPAQTALLVAVLPKFASQSGVSYRMAGAYQLGTSGATVTLTRRAPLAASDAGKPLGVNASDLLSAQVQASPDVETQWVGSPPTPDRRALYIDAPFAVLDAYINDLLAAGVRPVFEYF